MSANTKASLWNTKSYDFASLTPVNLSKFTKRDLRKYLANAYSLDEGIFSGIKDAKYLYTCPDRLRLPLIFYVGHTSTVYVNKLVLAGLMDKRVNPEFEVTFETGVDEMSWDDTENYRMGGAYCWPGLTEVLQYRKQVYDVIVDLIEQKSCTLPVQQESLWWSLFMGMEHERVHVETSSVLIRQLPIAAVQAPPGWKYAPLKMGSPAGPNTFVRVPTSKVVLGKPQDFPSYGWDNEYGHCEIEVPEFETTKYPVTNGEFLEFVQAGGYQNKDLWTEEGWRWTGFRNVKHPVFWVCRNRCQSNCGGVLSSHSHCDPTHFADSGNHVANGQNGERNGDVAPEKEFLLRVMYDLFPLPPDWPVEINYHEAKAFCRWKGDNYRLPTEAEYNVMRCNPPLSNQADCDPIFNPDYPANFNLKFGSSSPVNMFPPNKLGLHDICGNVWEWTEDQFNGLPDFKTSFLYDDFSSPCFDGRHNILMGGSWISTGTVASRFARYAFRRHFYQHAGFRMVRPKDTAPIPVRLCKTEVFVIGAGVQDNPVTVRGVNDTSIVPSANEQFRFETVHELDRDLREQYWSGKAQALSEFCEAQVLRMGLNRAKAVECGCGTGFSTFLLSKTFKEVLGVDYSGIIIDAAMKLQAGHTLTTSAGKEVNLNNYPGIDPKKVTFKQLTWTPNELAGYDFYLLSFLDRVTSPKGWLRKAWEVLTKDGLMVIASEKWNAELLMPYIDQWFALKSEETVAGLSATVWCLK